MTSNKIIYTIFCGRKKYLEIQMKYIKKLIFLGLIQEVHLWAFTTNHMDLEYLKEINAIDENIYKIFYPQEPEKRIWYHYYNYYYKNVNEYDIVIKADDDIIYIDINEFKNFIRNITEDKLYFPNIINNDVCAYYQTKYGIHNLFNYDVSLKIDKIGLYEPLTSWYMESKKAMDIHTLFLSEPNKCKLNINALIEYGNRISINFFAIKGSAIKKYYKYMTINTCIDDERYFSKMATIFGLHKINLNMNVVHFQFGPQNADGLLDNLFLDNYRLLSENIN